MANIPRGETLQTPAEHLCPPEVLDYARNLANAIVEIMRNDPTRDSRFGRYYISFLPTPANKGMIRITFLDVYHLYIQRLKGLLEEFGFHLTRMESPKDLKNFFHIKAEISVQALEDDMLPHFNAGPV